MYKFETSVLINRSLKDVFDYYNNPSKNAEWQSGTESAEWTSDEPHGVGSTYKWVTYFLGRKIESEVEATGWDPPNQVSIKSLRGPIPFEATTYLEAQGNGTRVTLQVQAELGGFFKLAEGLVGKQLEKQFDSNFSALKLLLEAG